MGKFSEIASFCSCLGINFNRDGGITITDIETWCLLFPVTVISFLYCFCALLFQFGCATCCLHVAVRNEIWHTDNVHLLDEYQLVLVSELLLFCAVLLWLVLSIFDNMTVVLGAFGQYLSFCMHSSCCLSSLV